MARRRSSDGQAQHFRPTEDYLLSLVERNRTTELQVGDHVVVAQKRFSCYGMRTVVTAVYPGRATNPLGVCTVQVEQIVCPHGCNWTQFAPTDLQRVPAERRVVLRPRKKSEQPVVAAARVRRRGNNTAATLDLGGLRG